VESVVIVTVERQATLAQGIFFASLLLLVGQSFDQQDAV
jgi:hypothetical protein